MAVMLWVSCSYAGIIEGRGATFPNPIYKAWSAAYFKTTRKRISYIPTDSGDGLASIQNKTVDFGASDMPLSPEALEKKKLFVFPTVIGAIAIVYHLNGVEDGALKLSREAISAIFDGKVAFWDDPTIANLNPSLKLPHMPIRVIVRSDASGTTYNFTYFLHQINIQFQATQTPHWHIPHKIEAASNADVWACMHETPNAIGYIEYSYKKRLQMDAAQIENRSGKFISPGKHSIQEALTHAQWDEKNYYYTVITDPEGMGSYPMIESTFLFISQEKNATNKAVIDFIDWIYRNGDQKAMALGYIPLPEKIKERARTFWKSQYLDR